MTKEEVRDLLSSIDSLLSDGDPADVGGGWETYDSLVAIDKARKLIAAELVKLVLNED